MYGGCALSTELNEVPPKAAADSRRSAGECCGLRDRRCRGPRCGALVPWAVWGPLAPGRHGSPPMPRAVWDAGVPTVAADGTAALKTWEARGRGGTHCFRAALLGRTGVAPSGHGKICAPCMIRGARAAKRAPSQQDLRAVYSQTAVCGAFRIHNAYILPRPAHFGYMAAKCCHEPALFPSEAPSGTHEVKKLPWLTARERTTSKYCHGSPPGNAPRHNLATAERPAPHGAERPTASAWLIVKHHAMCRSTITPCDARGAFSTAKKVSCRLRVSMWWNELPALA